MNKASARNKGGTASEKARTDGPVTRGANQKELVEDPTINITGPEEGRNYLEKNSLLVPVGSPVTTNMAAACLRQIAIMKGTIPMPVIYAIQALAYVLEDSDTLIANQTYHDGFQAELDNFTSEIQALITDARTKVDSKISELTEATNQLTQTTKNNNSHVNQSTARGIIGNDNGNLTYSQMLSRTQPDTDPKLLARYGIQRRQVMLEGIQKESAIGKLDDRGLKTRINEELEKLGAGEHVKARSATRQRDGGILLEMDSDFGAAWTRSKANTKTLCEKLGEEATVKERTYKLIALKVPLSADPENDEFVKEVQEANGLAEGTISAMRWAKPIHRRDKSQISAHVILNVTDADEGNRLLTLGMYIANKKVYVMKCKKEAIRCLKCQGWNHFAKECIAKDDTCGHCGKTGHWTKNCKTPGTKYCVSCKTDSHASYDRECPTYLRKQAEKDKSNPENALPFIQTDAPWTWNKTRHENARPNGPTKVAPPPAINYRPASQQARKRLRGKTPPSRAATGAPEAPLREATPPEGSQNAQGENAPTATLAKGPESWDDFVDAAETLQEQPLISFS